MGGRALVVTLVGLMTLSSAVFFAITRSSNDLMTNTDKYYLRQTAQNIAQSGVRMGLRQLSTTPSWRTGYPLMDMLDGKVVVRVVDTVLSGTLVIKIQAIGIANHNRSTERRENSIAFVPRGFIPATVKAAITTNNPIRTLGNLNIDGRDHTIAGSLLLGRGTLGIWTTRTLSQSGSSDIGGTYGGVDYIPQKPGNPLIIATGQVWPGGYPTTPDSVLGGASNGYPSGTLKAIAQSGAGGSQYVTNPALLSYPLRGVTYVELPSGGIWQSMNLNGSGLLIVHNNARNAAIKNLNQGTFTGLLIADDIIHIHTNIIGAIIGLTAFPSEGNCIGNGTGDVLYSAEAIMDATGSAGAGVASGAGSARNVLAWWE